MKEELQAMKEELDALLRNETLEITELPEGVKPISCKWVYKVNRKSDGTVNKFKARLVLLFKFMC